MVGIAILANQLRQKDGLTSLPTSPRLPHVWNTCLPSTAQLAQNAVPAQIVLSAQIASLACPNCLEPKCLPELLA